MTLILLADKSRVASAQEFHSKTAVFDQSKALGRALFPNEDQNKVYLSDDYAAPNSTLAPYSVSAQKEHLPGLQSLMEQSARTLVLKDLDEVDKTGYTLADAMADALWRKKVVEAFWGHLQ